MTPDEATALFWREFRPKAFTDEFLTAFANADGGLWLIGGAVYRTIARALYGDVDPPKDVDMLVERLRSPLWRLPGWTVEENRFGNPKLRCDGRELDLVPMRQTRAVVEMSARPGIESYLDWTPLTVQSIALDLRTRCVVGDVGICALRDRTVGVHNVDAFRHLGVVVGGEPEAYLIEKARSLGFTPILRPR